MLSSALTGEWLSANYAFHDIIYEVEKQRGALKRQAARARRYKRLREELRRWEQVQFAKRHAALTGEIQAAESRLA